MDKTRTVNTARNAAFAWSGHLLGILVTFVTRQIFVRFLSAEYLGLTGLFGNVLTVLSLVELGVGPAMVYSLYKPLAAGDTEKVRALMALLARAFRAVGLAVVALGLAFTPAYPLLMDAVPDIPGLNQIYWLFVLDTGASYCFAYKRALVTASQNRHIETGAHQFAAILLHLAQILALALTGNYIVFLLAQIAGTLFENALLTGWANRAFPYLRDKRPAPP
ncbi:MAG TPA: hypothetical protein PKE04_04145, partial [Clostridia bacterium]|nr:hypothetical protein [Clostridia bacterium]